MSVQTHRENRIWPNWWRFAGIDGIIWAILFFIGAFVIQGDSPVRDDPIDEIRAYWVEDGDTYLIGDYILGLAFIIFFLPYVIGLTALLRRAEGDPPIWSHMAFTGALLGVAFAGVAGLAWSTMAINLKDNPDLSDSTILLLMDLDLQGFVLSSFGLALFIGSTGFVVLRTGVLWRWLGAVGLLAAILLLIGAAWPIDGDDEGAIAVFGFVGYPLMLLFILVSSVRMIMMKEPPPAD
jgi:hypothetical protein